MVRYVVGAAIALTCTTLFAQTSPARQQFEVASVKPAAKDDFGSRFPMMMEAVRSRQAVGMIPMTGPDRVLLKNWTLRDLIAAAYSLRATQVSGPAWLADQNFDIEARVSDGTPKEDLNAMLQSLLEDRFGLKVHRAAQTEQGFALVVGKDGSKLKPAEPPPADTLGLTEEEQRAQLQQKMLADMASAKKSTQESSVPQGGYNTQSWSSITTDGLAAQLGRLAEAPVVDETGLAGKYSVTIRTWGSSDVPGGSIFDAVEKLGLKLEQRKVTVETVVVDQISKAPTPN